MSYYRYMFNVRALGLQVCVWCYDLVQAGRWHRHHRHTQKLNLYHFKIILSPDTGQQRPAAGSQPSTSHPPLEGEHFGDVSTLHSPSWCQTQVVQWWSWSIFLLILSILRLDFLHITHLKITTHKFVYFSSNIIIRKWWKRSVPQAE